VLQIILFSTIISSRKRKLQELYAVSRHIERSKPFPAPDVILRWGTIDDGLDELERKFLEDNDIERFVRTGVGGRCRLLM
jgi:chromatin modification-related protein VID21